MLDKSAMKKNAQNFQSMFWQLLWLFRFLDYSTFSKALDGLEIPHNSITSTKPQHAPRHTQEHRTDHPSPNTMIYSRFAQKSASRKR